MQINIALWIDSFLILRGLEEYILSQHNLQVSWRKGDSGTPNSITTNLVIIYGANSLKHISNTIKIPKILITEKKVITPQELRDYDIKGVLPIDAPPSLILTAIHSVATSNTYVHPDIRMPKVENTVLTNREREILVMLAAGIKVKDIANTLNLSVKTVEVHKFNLMGKLGIHNRAHLVAYAVHHGFIDLENYVIT